MRICVNTRVYCVVPYSCGKAKLLHVEGFQTSINVRVCASGCQVKYSDDTGGFWTCSVVHWTNKVV